MRDIALHWGANAAEGVCPHDSDDFSSSHAEAIHENLADAGPRQIRRRQELGIARARGHVSPTRVERQH